MRSRATRSTTRWLPPKEAAYVLLALSYNMLQLRLQKFKGTSLINTLFLRLLESSRADSFSKVSLSRKAVAFFAIPFNDE